MRRLALGALCCACATLGEPAGGDQNLPSSGVGPFRKLAGAETPGTAPYVLDDPAASYRQPAALPLAQGVALYVVMKSSGHDVIARTRADDGRAFFGAVSDIGHKPAVVLSTDQSWESPDLSHPSAVAVSGGVWLYYASQGSIGLARSVDGLAFTKAGAPVLSPDASGPIDSASVAQLPDGSFDMMLAQGDSIYEATSADGVSWARPTSAPVLTPGLTTSFDTLRVGSPCVVPRVDPAGRLQVRVVYTGYSLGEAGVTSGIGFAARYGVSGPLSRASGAVYSIKKNESDPTVYEPGDGTSLLYVDQDSTDGTYRAIAGAVAPPSVVLPPPASYPPSP